MSEDYRFARAQALMELGRYEDALLEWTTELGMGHGSLRNVFLYSFRAQTYEKLDRYEDALLDRTNAIASANRYNPPSDADWATWNAVRIGLYVDRLQIYLNLKRYEEALKDCNRALAFRGTKAHKKIALYNMRSLIYVCLKEPEKAKADLNEALKIAESQMHTCRKITRWLSKEGLEETKEQTAHTLTLAKSQKQIGLASQIQQALDKL